jgi:3-phenylpropionate/trans-cinnamate dioxygenase ferredoxin reductase subunit
MPTHVIVGASVAGAMAAETLRAEGFDGRIVLLGAEFHRPYERPPLSKQLLRGEMEVDGAYVHGETFYADHDIELLVDTRVQDINLRGRVVSTDDGASIPYDRLLLATGARPRRLRVPGSDLSGVHYLRDLADNRALREAASHARRAVVVGAGWIGSEVAASLRMLGLKVAIIDPAPVPLATVLGREVGAVYRDLHREHGVDLHLGETVEGFVGDTAVTGVRTGNGAVVGGDLVVVGIGVEPRIELGLRAGLDIDGGIAVDEFLESSAPGVFAAGDVAAAWHPRLRTRVRVEHWANARNQGVAAAKNMLGFAEPYERLPYFYSDQYDFGMEYSGYTRSWDRVVFRGDPAGREFIAFWVEDDRVVAAMNANVWDVVEGLQSLILSGERVEDSQLADPDVELGALAGVAS